MADRALVLGINRYKSVSSLRGCVNDARAMARLLAGTFGFPADGVKVLTDDEVTKRAVKSLVTGWLFDDARAGDNLALHFSGHGSYLADAGGEADEGGYDELICLHDMDFSRRTTFLTDDELGALLAKAPKGVHLTVFLDNCHAGTGTRLLIPEGKTMRSQAYPRLIEKETAECVARSRSRSGPRPVGEAAEAVALARAALAPAPEEQVLARFVEPPEEVVQAVEESGLRARSRAAGGKTRPAGMNHVLMAACLDWQTAADAYIDGDFHGAFTYFLCKTLRESTAPLDSPEVVARVERALKAGGFSQVPQLEPAGTTGPFFATRGTTAEPTPTTTPTAGPEIEPPGPGMPTGGPEAVPAPPRPPGDLAAGEAAELFREFLRTTNRLIDLIGGVGARPELEVRAGVGRHLVYVHGIGSHGPGFSDGWWRAMRRFTPSLEPGGLGPGGNRHEAIWSDLVNRVRALEATTPGGSAEEAEARELAEQLRDTLADRVEQQAAAVASAARATGREPEGPRGADAGVILEGSVSLERGALGALGGIDDFARYLASRDLRDRVMDRFRRVVEPLARGGASLVVIAHSWGTVVAYEAMRLMDLDGTLPAGSVRDFFTVGSALSIPLVKSRLLPEVKDGRKPRLVRRWWNLDAEGDPVGGRLAGQPFAVDGEFLNLPAVGCGSLLWVLPNPVCAHSSYFHSENLGVNRDVFGRLVEGA